MIKPYFETELGKLYHGDCFDIMKEFPRYYFNTILTDPPFFMPASHYQSRIEWPRMWADVSILQKWWEIAVLEIARICKKKGHVLIFCNGDSYPAFYPVMFPLWTKLKCLVWDKCDFGLGRIWRNQFELIIAARNTGHYYPSDYKAKGDVLKYKATISSERIHPVQKPINLLIDLVKATTPKEGILLDPFFGSGTTAIACEKLGIKWIGIEKEKNYCESSRKLIKDKTRQKALFN